MNLDPTNEKAELPEDPTNERPGIPGFLKNFTEDCRKRQRGKEEGGRAEVRPLGEA